MGERERLSWEPWKMCPRWVGAKNWTEEPPFSGWQGWDGHPEPVLLATAAQGGSPTGLLGQFNVLGIY